MKCVLNEMGLAWEAESPEISNSTHRHGKFELKDTKNNVLLPPHYDYYSFCV